MPLCFQHKEIWIGVVQDVTHGNVLERILIRGIFLDKLCLQGESLLIVQQKG